MSSHKRGGRAAAAASRLSLDLRLPPAGVLEKVARSINLPRRRFLGVIKTRPEYVGRIEDGGFEVWERRERAVHAVGTVEPRGSGARVRVTFGLAPITRLGLVIFYGLYAAVMVAIASQRNDLGTAAIDLAVATVGAGLIALVFLAAARRQRRALEAFLSRTLATRD